MIVAIGKKAHSFLQGALEYADNSNGSSSGTAPRLLVRIAIGWMARQDRKRAKRALAKAWKYYSQNKSYGPDELAIQTRKQLEEGAR